MTIIRPNIMPRLWWLFPWSYARQLHRNCVALKALTDKQDDLLKDKVSTRPRWKIVPNTHEGVTRYYFLDTESYIYGFADAYPVRGKSFLYDGPSKSFVSETDPAKAIDYCDTLNGGKNR